MGGFEDAEAADAGTRTNQPTRQLPSLAKATKIKDEDLIPLDIDAFRFSMDGSSRAGDDICGQHFGSATRARSRAAIDTVKRLPNLCQTPKRTVLALREASKRADIRLIFKSASLMDAKACGVPVQQALAIIS